MAITSKVVKPTAEEVEVVLELLIIG